MMITINPFVELSTYIPSIAMQAFLIFMVILTIGGTILDMMLKKYVKFFFENAKSIGNYLVIKFVFVLAYKFSYCKKCRYPTE